jgi:hypothetical protein
MIKPGRVIELNEHSIVVNIHTRLSSGIKCIQYCCKYWNPVQCLEISECSIIENIQTRYIDEN